MIHKTISLQAVLFITDNLRGIYMSDNETEFTYTNYMPYQLHEPCEFSGSDFYIYLIKSQGVIKCAVEIFPQTDEDIYHQVDDPEGFIRLLMKWHPNTNVYGCEQRSNWHDRLQNELGCSTNNRPKRAKI